MYITNHLIYLLDTKDSMADTKEVAPIFTRKDVEKMISKALSSAKTTEDIFPQLLDQFRVSMETPCASIAEFKRRTTTAKGGLFEIFCY